jgi:hypothetical protein
MNIRYMMYEEILPRPKRVFDPEMAEFAPGVRGQGEPRLKTQKTVDREPRNAREM